MARPSSSATLNIAELERILNERKREVDKRVRRREKLQRQIDAIDVEITKLSGGELGLGRGSNGSAGGPGSRAKNDKPLPDYIEEVLAKTGKPMRVGEIVEGVQGLGYKSNSQSFKNIVNQMLIKERKRFAQVDRGIYGLAPSKK
jgi:hypothetical protein